MANELMQRIENTLMNGESIHAVIVFGGKAVKIDVQWMDLPDEDNL